MTSASGTHAVPRQSQLINKSKGSNEFKVIFKIGHEVKDALFAIVERNN